MKTFEEKFTAWVDGRLSGAQLAAFERELEAHPEALADKEAALDLGNLLRSNLPPAPLPNPDFFNHQVLLRIHATEAPAPSPARRPIFWTLPRMVFSGIFLLLLSTVFYFLAVPATRREVRQNQQYVTNILNARSDDPGITATSFHSKAENVDVLWLDGPAYIPPGHKLK